MQEYNVDLLDNIEFIDWAASSPEKLPGWVKQYFYSSEGGSPFETT
jgi:hypothetical protein